MIPLSPSVRKQLDSVGNLESISLLVLLLIAMPLKYIWGQPAMVRWVGLVHGVLFVVFVVVLLRAQIASKWPLRYTVLGVLSSFVPFGPKWMMSRLLDR
jgi:integral membrane protein